MGYTQKWHQHRDFTDQEWATLMRCANYLTKRATLDGIVLCGWDGTGAPVVSATDIGFNGSEANGEDYETFLLSKKQPEKSGWTSQEEFDKEGAFVFCKTAREPYDAVVVTMLVVARKVAPGALDLSSDGGDEVFDSVVINGGLAKAIQRGAAGEIDLPNEYDARFAQMDL